jgi:hypothetical protein
MEFGARLRDQLRTSYLSTVYVASCKGNVAHCCTIDSTFVAFCWTMPSYSGQRVPSRTHGAEVICLWVELDTRDPYRCPSV